MNFHPSMVIERQALTDFIAKFTYASIAEVAGTVDIFEAMKVVEAKGEKKSKLVKEDA